MPPRRPAENRPQRHENSMNKWDTATIDHSATSDDLRFAPYRVDSATPASRPGSGRRSSTHASWSGLERYAFTLVHCALAYTEDVRFAVPNSDQATHRTPTILLLAHTWRTRSGA